MRRTSLSVSPLSLKQSHLYRHTSFVGECMVVWRGGGRWMSLVGHLLRAQPCRPPREARLGQERAFLYQPSPSLGAVASWGQRRLAASGS